MCVFEVSRCARPSLLCGRARLVANTKGISEIGIVKFVETCMKVV